MQRFFSWKIGIASETNFSFDRPIFAIELRLSDRINHTSLNIKLIEILTRDLCRKNRRAHEALGKNYRIVIVATYNSRYSSKTIGVWKLLISNSFFTFFFFHRNLILRPSCHYEIKHKRYITNPLILILYYIRTISQVQQFSSTLIISTILFTPGSI